MPRFHRFLLVSVLCLASCATAPIPEQTPEGNVGTACSTDAECVTPTTYLIRSVCPFTSYCIDGACAVVCPIAEAGACAVDSDCTCDRVIAPGASDSCSCVNSRCVAVMQTGNR